VRRSFDGERFRGERKGVLEVKAWEVKNLEVKVLEVKNMETKYMDIYEKPTIENCNVLQEAFDYFNNELFDSKLPECMIIMENSRKRKGGHFCPNQFQNNTGKVIDELFLNSLYFRENDDIYTLSILVHEMCHLWKEHFGLTKGTRRYHDKEWGEEMRRVGLMPSDTGEEGGAQVGYGMSHYIIKGGQFDEFSKQLMNEEFQILWRGMMEENDSVVNETEHVAQCTYICKQCDVSVRGVIGLEITCKKCGFDFVALVPGSPLFK
jgi:predicted SprT family Zn-dependent metalloprotease